MGTATIQISNVETKRIIKGALIVEFLINGEMYVGYVSAFNESNEQAYSLFRLEKLEEQDDVLSLEQVEPLLLPILIDTKAYETKIKENFNTTKVIIGNPIVKKVSQNQYHVNFDLNGDAVTADIYKYKNSAWVTGFEREDGEICFVASIPDQRTYLEEIEKVLLPFIEGQLE